MRFGDSVLLIITKKASIVYLLKQVYLEFPLDTKCKKRTASQLRISFLPTLSSGHARLPGIFTVVIPRLSINRFCVFYSAHTLFQLDMHTRAGMEVAYWMFFSFGKISLPG